MLQFSFNLDRRTTTKTGAHPLKLRIYRSRTERVFVSLKMFYRPDQWDSTRERVVNTVTATVDNIRLDSIRADVGRLLLEIDQSEMCIAISEIRERVEAAIGQKKPRAASFYSYFEEHVPKVLNAKTKESFVSTLKKAHDFDPTDKPFPAITVGWLRDFELFCKMGGMSVNGISVYMRNIRTVYNRAIDDGIANLNDYPFRRFKIKQEKTRKRALTVEQLRELRDYPCEEFQREYRDIFMLIFYLGGINMIDLFGLTKIEGEHIDYIRSKTGVPTRTKVESEALEIINRYRGKEHLLAVADRYKNHEDYTKRINRALRSIGSFEMVPNAAKIPKKNKKEITPAFPGVTVYWARHTWATLAAEIDIPDPIIGMVLAHVDNTMEGVYIKRNQKKADEAVRKVIDYVNG